MTLEWMISKIPFSLLLLLGNVLFVFFPFTQTKLRNNTKDLYYGHKLEIKTNNKYSTFTWFFHFYLPRALNTFGLFSTSLVFSTFSTLLCVSVLLFYIDNYSNFLYKDTTIYFSIVGIHVLQIAFLTKKNSMHLDPSRLLIELKFGSRLVYLCKKVTFM